jgi:tetratricopeptide (TPR) repeat protein
MGFAAILILAALHADDLELSRLSSVEIKDRAEAAFESGVHHRDDPEIARREFRKAVTCFEELRRRGARNALLFRNLGNAYFLAGDLPYAILSYRRGLRLSPGDVDLMEGLDLARERVSYPEGSRLGRPGPAGHASWLARIGGEWLIGGAIFLYFTACVGFTRWLMTRRIVLLMLALLSVLGAGVLTLFAVREASKQASGPIVVIAEDSVLLRRGDSLSYPARYETPLNRGVEGRVLARRGNWLQIELSGGEVGWVMTDYALVDDEQNEES